MTTEPLSEQGLKIYLRAATQELQVCPHCETWFLIDCEAGQGCPTPDGRNGAVTAAMKEEGRGNV